MLNNLLSAIFFLFFVKIEYFIRMNSSYAIFSDTSIFKIIVLALKINPFSKELGMKCLLRGFWILMRKEERE